MTAGGHPLPWGADRIGAARLPDPWASATAVHIITRTCAFPPASGPASVAAGLRVRWARGILSACRGRLPGFRGAIRSAFPATTVQRCVVQLRNSLRPVARRDAAELRKIRTAPGEEAAPDAPAVFAAWELDQNHPQAAKAWEAFTHR